MKDIFSALGRQITGKHKNERRADERRHATKRDRIIFYSKVFNGEAVDRRVNLFDRRQS
jgi:hypothetical protein